jgi:hypothetical protein
MLRVSLMYSYRGHSKKTYEVLNEFHAVYLNENYICHSSLVQSQ